MKIYNSDVMKANRQIRGLEPDDTSLDNEILKMDKTRVFRNYCQWNGLMGGWYEYLLQAVESIYDVKLSEGI